MLTEPSHESLTGLTQDEATKLQSQFGFNDIPEEKKNPLLKFLLYFWGPIPWMIETAAILSAVIAHWEDFAIIVLLLMANAVVGFFQERKADNAIELLKNSSFPMLIPCLITHGRISRPVSSCLGISSRLNLEISYPQMPN